MGVQPFKVWCEDHDYLMKNPDNDPGELDDPDVSVDPAGIIGSVDVDHGRAEDLVIGQYFDSLG